MAEPAILAGNLIHDVSPLINDFLANLRRKLYVSPEEFHGFFLFQKNVIAGRAVEGDPKLVVENREFGNRSSQNFSTNSKNGNSVDRFSDDCAIFGKE
ncbi:hypothetical protein H7X65_01180 [Candidatus Parcubacteria bacterium]|nr:hypothetical protein [Candidatus Parcubacteria bacterium]